jgi:hypothetical protein
MLIFLSLACTPIRTPPITVEPIVELGELTQVVPADNLPAGVTPQTSNNNLDVVEHMDGKLYLAFRTGPNHFASSQVHMYVLSSEDDGQQWTLEQDLFMETDLREPRFLSLDDKLVLHYAVLGTNALDFEPQGTMRTVLRDNAWSEPEWIFDDGFIPWRTRVMAGVPTMIGYTGGDDIYDQDGDTLPQLEVRWLTSEDGLNWTGPTVWTGGGSETDITHTDNAVVAVIRNEGGDANGFGSLVCRAELDAPHDWDCVHDCRKYDSPLMFTHGGEAWLIGRRNVTEDGCFDIHTTDTDLVHSEQFIQNSAAYWQTPKRCSLWHVDDADLTVTHIEDFPSAGDTCFPSILGEDGQYELWNYTTDPEDADMGWLTGQQGPTMITRQPFVLRP